jgi:hypothetical protein
MDRNQQYLTTLLEKVPKWELSDPLHQEAFDKMKDSLTNATDLQNQLKELYSVANFSDVALGLMWIADKVGRDPSKLESTLEEESFVLNLLKKGFGGSPAETAMPEQSLGFDVQQPTTTVEPAGAVETVPESFAAELASPLASPGADDVRGGSEEVFSTTLEKLLEAVQSGSEERTILLEELTSQAEGIVAAQDSDSDYKTFCGYLIEFLKYVSANQLFDDIRVMNLISNVYDPFSQWAKSDPMSRSGILEQSIEMLRDFRALFE